MAMEELETFYPDHLDGFSDPATSPTPKPGEYQSTYSFPKVSIVILFLSHLPIELAAYGRIKRNWEEKYNLLDFWLSNHFASLSGRLIRKVFNIRDDEEGEQERAVESAIHEMNILNGYNRDASTEEGKTVRFGIGVYTGNACLHQVMDSRGGRYWITGPADEAAFALAQQALRQSQNPALPLDFGHLLICPRTYQGLQPSVEEWSASRFLLQADGNYQLDNSALLHEPTLYVHDRVIWSDS